MRLKLSLPIAPGRRCLKSSGGAPKLGKKGKGDTKLEAKGFSELVVLVVMLVFGVLVAAAVVGVVGIGRVVPGAGGQAKLKGDGGHEESGGKAPGGRPAPASPPALPPAPAAPSAPG